MSQQKPNDRIEVDIDLDEMDITSAESKATYEKNRKYVEGNNGGMKESSLNIAQVKKKCGIEVGENYNKAKSEDAKQPQCTEKKEKATVKALKYFRMV